MTGAPTTRHDRRAPRRYWVAVLAALVALLAIAVALLGYEVFDGASSSEGLQGSGVAATETRELAAFTGVELAGSNIVTIRVGGEQSIVVHADDNLLSQVTTEVDAGTLLVGNAPGSFTTKSPMRVDVIVPTLDALTLAGSGIVSATEIRTPSLTVDLSGSGVVRLSGLATQLDVSLTGSGDAQLEQLIAQEVHAIVSGSGRILVTATKSLDASVPGSGAIMYRGNPEQVTTNISGTGAITRG